MTWTGAEVPAAPALSEATNNSVRVTISSGTNPEWTVYAIYNNTVGKYLTAAGGLQTGATWHTFAGIGGAGGKVNGGLASNDSYTYKVKAKNAVGIETQWSDDSESLNTTGANPPGSANYSNLGQDKLTANWTNSGNPAGTKYLTQISTAADYSLVISSSEWIETFSHEFAGLLENSKYYCRVYAKDATESTTDPTELGSIYTLIEAPDGIVWEATDENYITVKVTGTLSNLSASFSGILFEELVTGENPGDYIKKKFWALDSLEPNTTYAFRITARNGDGESGEAAGPFVRTTLLEAATGMTFVEVSSTTIKVQAAGTFTNPLESSSAVKIYETQTSTDSGWSGCDAQFGIEGLKPNTSYYFYTVSRNSEGTEGPVAAGTVKYTYAAVPSTPTPTAGSSPSEGNYIDVTPESAHNPEGMTEYLIDIAKDSGFTVIVSSDQITTSVLRFAGLEPNTTYYVRSRAKNGDGEITGYGPYADVVTCPSSPSGFTSVSQTYSSIKWQWNEVGGAATYKFYPSQGTIVETAATNWTMSSLDSNTSYWAYATAVGVTGEGGASDLASAYTLIETPEGVGFGTINSTSIKVNTAGSFTAMGEGESAVRVGRFTMLGSLISGTTSPWRQPSSDYDFSGLTPNKEYYFNSQARNVTGSTTPWSGGIWLSTYTYAETPLAPSLSNPTTYSLKVTIDRGNNPTLTEYSM